MDIDALAAAARTRMSEAAFDYVEGGADDERTLRGNVAAWQQLQLRPRVLRDVSAVTTEVTVLGSSITAPVMVAPTSMHRLAHDEGELATARATARAGTVLVHSMMATRTLEDTAAAGGSGPRWFQLYMLRDRGATQELVQRAAASGYQALVLTVDAPVPGNRRAGQAHAFELPAGMVLANLTQVLDALAGGMEGFARGQFDQAVTFDDLAWLRDVSDLPVVVKGVLRGDDAERCVASGAAAIAVSNHGGRQVDTAIPTVNALIDVAERVGDQAEIYVDGGIRDAACILKALALGANAVMVGRPVLWALAADGEEGVTELLSSLQRELAKVMALCGVVAPGDASPDLVADPRHREEPM